MHEFLKSVAAGYAGLLDREKYTFVFPNTRSARFFNELLKDYKAPLDDRQLSSLCITMTELVEKNSGRGRLSPDKLLFMLYDVYRSLRAGGEIRSFDRFRYWGQMILQDFNEVDKYLVDPDQIFRNVSEYKEIQALYLTDEQKAIIREFWGEEPYWQPMWNAEKIDEDERPFWAHAGGNSKTETKFRQLWQLLAPLYAAFRKLMDRDRACYPGLAYRLVAEKLRAGGNLKEGKVVFIGFNRLSTSEHVIFETLKRRGQAHFYWDYNPVLMNPAQGNRAGRFISKYAEHFTDSLPEVTFTPVDRRHVVDVIAVPSNVAQTKVAATLLADDSTAVVLPSDELLLPMARAIPPQFPKVNITMGYPLRHSALAQLYSLLFSLQVRARRSSAGELLFFRDDVMTLLTDPLIQADYAAECGAAIEFIKERHLFNIPASLVAAEPVFESFATLLLPIGADAPVDETASYISMAMEFAASKGLVNMLEQKCVETIKKYVDDLAHLADDYKVEMESRTFFTLVERTVFQRAVTMAGRDFDAMQIMGVLETRGLGFDHVVMLSMTDAVYPGRRVGRSFIPESLRHAYGLPTRDHAEADYAYHFYRLLSNSSHMSLLYDSRSGGLRSGEMSRFIFQLIYLDLPGVEVHRKAAAFNASTTRDLKPFFPDDFQVEKTPEIMARLERYRDPKLLHTYSLSASTLRKYLACPLSFYLERVQDIRPPEEEKADVDAGIMGNTVHEVAERVYKTLSPDPEAPLTITKDILRNLMDGGFNDLLNREIRRSLRANVDMLRRYVPDPADPDKRIENPELDTAELSDKAENIYFPMIREYMCRLFTYETTPFSFIDAEQNVKFHWTNATRPGEPGVNFTMKIDRLDSIDTPQGPVTRVVDYKTGGDVPKFDSVEQLFEFCAPKHPHAVFQLLTYCAAYVDYHGRVKANPALLRPQIFPLKKLEKEGFPLITYAKKPLESFAQVEAEFRGGLTQMFADLFDPSLPFDRCQDDSGCRFCNFYDFCHVTPRDKRKTY